MKRKTKEEKKNNYRIKDVEDAKKIAIAYLKDLSLENALKFGLPEIVVDRIGEGSRIVELAKEIQGNVVQMSMSNWVREVCTILHKVSGYEHEILSLDNQTSIKYIKEKIRALDLRKFINREIEDFVEKELFPGLE